MNMMIWVIAGGAAGIVAAYLFNHGGRDGRFGYIALGIVGAVAGAQLLAPLFGPPPEDANAFSMPMLVFAVIGAAACLAAGDLVRRRYFP